MRNKGIEIIVLSFLILLNLVGCTNFNDNHNVNDHAFNLYEIKDGDEILLSQIYMDEKDRNKIELISEISNKNKKCTDEFGSPDYLIVQMKNEDRTIEDRDSFTLNIWLKDGIVYSEIETNLIDTNEYIAETQVTEKEFVDILLRDI